MNRAAKFVTHLVLVFCAFLLAYELRRALPVVWWFESPDALRVLRWGALYAGIAGLVEIVSQTERGAWRFISAREAMALLRNMTLTAILFVLTIFFLDRGVQLPRSVLPLAWLLSFLLLVGVRLAWRLAHDRSLAVSMLPSWWRPRSGTGTPLLIVGSMAEAERHVRHFLGDPAAPYWPVAVVTPHRQEQGLQLHGTPCVGSPDRLESLIDARFRDARVKPAILFVDDPVGEFGISAERIGRLRRAGVALLRPQPIADMDDGDVGSRLREIALEEFLPRTPVSLDPAPIRALVAGKRVLVTGAGGSIGSEIARQMASLGCAHLTMLDHSEFLLFEIDRELGGVKTAMTRRAVLANVRDEARVREVFEQERPDLVFHAAALKHVSLVENNPAEGVLTNVYGTWNVVRAATSAKAEQFVLISTDKAVDPANVMGATKRIAETLLEMAPDSETRLSTVRFGNVLGSAGSVVPIFRDQIARGGPVTVTHPDVNRYFMTIPEAVQLVLHSTAFKAGRADDGPSKFLLEMGEPVKIADLARQMIELSGRTPDVDIKIEFTGLKAGEKIAEELADAGEDARPCIDGILEVTAGGRICGLDTDRLQDLIALAQSGRGPELTLRVAETIHGIRGQAGAPDAPRGPEVAPRSGPSNEVRS
ncbi:polysaccharide biosynthesis protein [Brevundimonas sp. UBA7664]|uniref:polysaccharide biosynthesis protein n=1 Tax=Brevundimonas sp. UBA7664 TaxID=1946141 RepID=UPI0025BA8BE8|nr:nucleoside-diphosphate sugar epimerase/dehydratase [Brevundimonas sp. UBA7664]